MAESAPWAQMDPVDYDRYWSRVDMQLGFRPGMSADRWPAIAEPPGSVTFSLARIFDGSTGDFAAGEAAVNAEVLRALVAVFGSDEVLIALDWQHPGYWFRPHSHSLQRSEWRVPPFPNGDYYLLLSDDLSTGTFGHPWEQSICVLGERLIEALAPVFESWLPVLRRGLT